MHPAALSFDRTACAPPPRADTRWHPERSREEQCGERLRGSLRVRSPPRARSAGGASGPRAVSNFGDLGRGLLLLGGVNLPQLLGGARDMLASGGPGSGGPGGAGARDIFVAGGGASGDGTGSGGGAAWSGGGQSRSSAFYSGPPPAAPRVKLLLLMSETEPPIVQPTFLVSLVIESVFAIVSSLYRRRPPPLCPGSCRETSRIRPRLGVARGGHPGRCVGPQASRRRQAGTRPAGGPLLLQIRRPKPPSARPQVAAGLVDHAEWSAKRSNMVLEGSSAARFGADKRWPGRMPACRAADALRFLLALI